MDSQNATEVVVVDVKMRFWSMVIFMVKWVIASIPAFIILAVVWMIAVVIVRSLLGGAMTWHGRGF